MTGPLLRCADVAEGLAAEAALLAAGQAGVCLWTAAQRGLVLPASTARQTGFAAAAAASAARGWPLHTRPSGGGTVPQGPGVLNLALVFPAPAGFGIADGYRLLCAPLVASLATLDLAATPAPVPGAFCDGLWNLALRGRKIVGTAQRWRATAQGPLVLAHALVLLSGDPAPACRAIAALHRNLGDGFAPDPALHTTLAAESRSVDAAAFARQLHLHASRELAALTRDGWPCAA